MGPSVEGSEFRRKGPASIYKDLILLQLAALVYLSDQFTKFLVRELLPYTQSFPMEGFFRFTHTHNTGSAFGLFQGQNTPLILVAILGIIILTLIYRSQQPPSNLLRFSIGLQLGGAAGNLTDRLALGHVTDFLDVGAWPVFNLADSSIVVGLVLLGWLFLKPRRQSQASPAPEVYPEIFPEGLPIEISPTEAEGPDGVSFSVPGYISGGPASSASPFAMGEPTDSQFFPQIEPPEGDFSAEPSSEDHLG